jgi:15-cis-phytoene desaturase
MRNYHVVVIGGGVAGLATGALLAKQGYAVAVLEKGNQLGGRAYSYEEKGFTFNYGAHGTYRPYSGLLAEVMRRLGRPPIPHGIVKAENSFWSDGDRFGFVGGKPQQMLSTAFFAMPTRLRFMRFAANLRTMRSEPPADMTFGEWLAQQTSDEALRRFALAICATTSSRETTSAT